MSEADKKALAELEAEAAKLASPVNTPEWIRCRVTVPNCHVGTIDCQIPASTPRDHRHLAALRAAAEVRGIVVNRNGVPQFGTAPVVEYMEN